MRRTLVKDACIPISGLHQGVVSRWLAAVTFPPSVAPSKARLVALRYHLEVAACSPCMIFLQDECYRLSSVELEMR